MVITKLIFNGDYELVLCSYSFGCVVRRHLYFGNDISFRFSKEIYKLSCLKSLVGYQQLSVTLIINVLIFPRHVTSGN